MLGAWTLLAPAVAAPLHVGETRVHDIHLTYSRVVLDGTSVVWRVRLFRDDLEKGLRRFARNSALDVNTAAGDSAFGRYFNAVTPVKVDGKVVAARVLQSGKDMDEGEQEMRWYLLEFAVPPRYTTLALKVGLLFDEYSDQRNIVTILRMPEQTRHSLFFARGDTLEQTLRFR